MLKLAKTGNGKEKLYKNQGSDINHISFTSTSDEDRADVKVLNFYKFKVNHATFF